MKSNIFTTLLISLFIFACQSKDSDSKPTEDIIELTPLDPLESTKTIFQNLISGADSAFYSETSTTLTYGAYPQDDNYDPGKELFGTFIIEKSDIYSNDLNGDKWDDFVIKYTFLPYMENNELTYYKVLIQENNMLLEAGDIFGGGRCEGPILDKIDITKKTMTLKGLDFAEGDPCCCPTVEVENKYQIVDNKVKEIKDK